MAKAACWTVTDTEARKRGEQTGLVNFFMNQNYKNSYKVTEKELVSLSVYNVGFQKCDPLYQWGPGIQIGRAHV